MVLGQGVGVRRDGPGKLVIILISSKGGKGGCLVDHARLWSTILECYMTVILKSSPDYKWMKM